MNVGCSYKNIKILKSNSIFGIVHRSYFPAYHFPATRLHLIFRWEIFTGSFAPLPCPSYGFACPGLHSRAGQLGFETVTCWSQIQHPNHSATRPRFFIIVCKSTGTYHTLCLCTAQLPVTLLECIISYR